MTPDDPRQRGARVAALVAIRFLPAAVACAGVPGRRAAAKEHRDRRQPDRAVVLVVALCWVVPEHRRIVARDADDGS
jgi:hypothetical protein